MTNPYDEPADSVRRSAVVEVLYEIFPDATDSSLDAIAGRILHDLNEKVGEQAEEIRALRERLRVLTEVAGAAVVAYFEDGDMDEQSWLGACDTAMAALRGVLDEPAAKPAADFSLHSSARWRAVPSEETPQP